VRASFFPFTSPEKVRGTVRQDLGQVLLAHLRVEVAVARDDALVAEVDERGHERVDLRVEHARVKVLFRRKLEDTRELIAQRPALIGSYLTVPGRIVAEWPTLAPFPAMLLLRACLCCLWLGVVCADCGGVGTVESRSSSESEDESESEEGETAPSSLPALLRPLRPVSGGEKSPSMARYLAEVGVVAVVVGIDIFFIFYFFFAGEGVSKKNKNVGGTVWSAPQSGV